jgi:hypothetical protein
MVWHILKKDWKLLGPLVAALAVVQGLVAFARFREGQFNAPLPGVPGSLLVLLAAAIVITLVVHQDPIPGVRQDWLVRPIARRDLFLAKLIFVVMLVQGPMLVTDLLQGLANGFSFGQSAGAAIACAVWVLLTLSLPVLAFAALTAGMTETLVAALGVLAVVMAFLIVPALAGATRPTALTGFAWVPSLLREALLLVAAAGVLVLQYRWRRTWDRARPVCRGFARRALCLVFAVAHDVAPGTDTDRQFGSRSRHRDRVCTERGEISTSARPGYRRCAGEARRRPGGCGRGEPAAARRGRHHGVSPRPRVRPVTRFEAARRSLRGHDGRSRRPNRVSRDRQRPRASRYGGGCDGLPGHPGARRGV